MQIDFDLKCNWYDHKIYYANLFGTYCDIKKNPPTEKKIMIFDMMVYIIIYQFELKKHEF